MYMYVYTYVVTYVPIYIYSRCECHVIVVIRILGEPKGGHQQQWYHMSQCNMTGMYITCTPL